LKIKDLFKKQDHYQLSTSEKAYETAHKPSTSFAQINYFLQIECVNEQLLHKVPFASVTCHTNVYRSLQQNLRANILTIKDSPCLNKFTALSNIDSTRYLTLAFNEKLKPLHAQNSLTKSQFHALTLITLTTFRKVNKSLKVV
jgi:hypothetical protein